MRPSWIEIDLTAIEKNVRQIRTYLNATELCAVVKADAYGHGDIPVAEAALRGGATWLAVALVEEGVRVREAGINVPILLLSESRHAQVETIVAHGLTPTVYSADFTATLAAAAEKASASPYSAHLKLDTGMHRVGAPPIDAFEVARVLHHDDRLVLDGVWTHFAVADSDPAYTERQNRAFTHFVEALASEGIHPGVLHAANTAAAFTVPETRHNLCRIGLGMYGMHPTPATHSQINLKPAMRVVSHVASLRDLSRGARPSYGRRRPLPEAGRVATIPIGYADGVSRGLSASGSVLIRGKRYPFAGTITMDMVMVDVGRDEVNVGDEVVFMGTQQGESIPAEEWADLLDTITYEIVCNFGPRLPRRYIGGQDSGE